MQSIRVVLSETAPEGFVSVSRVVNGVRVEVSADQARAGLDVSPQVAAVLVATGVLRADGPGHVAPTDTEAEAAAAAEAEALAAAKAADKASADKTTKENS